MLDLDKLSKMAVETTNKIYDDRLEPDKILINISDLIHEFIKMHIEEVNKLKS